MAEYDLTKLFSLMERAIPDGESITFSDNGKEFTLKTTAADSMTITAVMPSNGKRLDPVTIDKQDIKKGYRRGANFHGKNGNLVMTQGHWKLGLVGSLENEHPTPDIIDGPLLEADFEPLRSIPVEDSYGGATWAMFLPSGIAALVTTYSLAATIMEPKKRPAKPIAIQANAIYPILQITDPKVTVSEYAVGIEGMFGVGSVKANIYIALSKPTTPHPEPHEVEAMFPGKDSKFTVSAAALRECIESAKKTFDKDATNLTFSLTDVGMQVNLQSNTASMDETIVYMKRPEKSGGEIVINTDIIVNAFKAVRALTSVKALAKIKMGEEALYIRIVENKETVGGFVLARS